jgi:hypothetical protein
MTMRKLGRLGGKARLVRMTAEQRSAIARKAATASAVVRRKQAEKRAQRRAKQRQRDTVWALKAFGKARSMTA